MKAKKSQTCFQMEGNFDCGKSDGIQSISSTVTQSDLSFSSKVKKRKRKDSSQMKVLTEAFEENPQWSKDQILKLSESTRLTQTQVYKWNWDHQKKVRPSSRHQSQVKILCNESLSSFSVDDEMLVLQRLYKIKFSAFKT
jgi:hypothetical protein